MPSRSRIQSPQQVASGLAAETAAAGPPPLDTASLNDAILNDEEAEAPPLSEEAMAAVAAVAESDPGSVQQIDAILAAADILRSEGYGEQVAQEV